MEFDEAKGLLIESLEIRKFGIFLERPLIWIKNKLYTREVNAEFVLNIIKSCKEENYYSRFSSDADDNKSHIFINKGWYIKYCLFEGVVNFISIHEDE